MLNCSVVIDRIGTSKRDIQSKLKLYQNRKKIDQQIVTKRFYRDLRAESTTKKIHKTINCRSSFGKIVISVRKKSLKNINSKVEMNRLVLDTFDAAIAKNGSKTQQLLHDIQNNSYNVIYVSKLPQVLNYIIIHILKYFFYISWV